MAVSRFPYVLFDWGGTLMSEDGPAEIAMAYWDKVEAIAGAEDTLATLAPWHTLCLATNAVVSGREQIELALERASLRHYISQIFCSSEIGVRKESPDFWMAVTSGLGVGPHEVVMVGDSLEPDVIAPRRAGIFSVWFNENGKHGAAAVEVPSISRLADLVPLLRVLAPN